MTMALADRPWYRLTVHFLLGFFDFGVLSEAGSDAFRRLLIGIVAMMLAVGLFLPRVYMGKYSRLSAASETAEPFLRAVTGDEALAIGVPMLVVAIATVLVSHSLFPGETDFRVLLVLPISRRLVFLTKLFALAIFSGGVTVAGQLAMTPLVLLILASRWAEQRLVFKLAAYAIATFG